MRLLVDEDEGACDEEQDGQADGVGDPDEGCCDERHGRVKIALELKQAGVYSPVGSVEVSRRHIRVRGRRKSAVREDETLEAGSWLQVQTRAVQ